MEQGVLQRHSGVIRMAADQPKHPTAVDADNGRLREELEQLLKNARPVESRTHDGAGCSLVIRGK